MLGWEVRRVKKGVKLGGWVGRSEVVISGGSVGLFWSGGFEGPEWRWVEVD